MWFLHSGEPVLTALCSFPWPPGNPCGLCFERVGFRASGSVRLPPASLSASLCSALRARPVALSCSRASSGRGRPCSPPFQFLRRPFQSPIASPPRFCSSLFPVACAPCPAAAGSLRGRRVHLLPGGFPPGTGSGLSSWGAALAGCSLLLPLHVEKPVTC